MPLRPQDVLFFLHIPKTAGITLARLLDARFSPEEIFPVPDVTDYARMFRELSPEEFSRIRFVRGHFWFGPNDRAIHDFLSSDPVTITVLRNPIDRTVSAFQHVVRDESHWLRKVIGMEPGMKLEEFVRHPAAQSQVRNVQARLVVGAVPGNPRGGTGDPAQEQRMSDDELLEHAMSRIESFAWVGLTERLSEAIALLNETFGWNATHDVPRLNANPKPSEHYRVSAEARRAIEERTQVDAALYKHASHLFAKRLESISHVR